MKILITNDDGYKAGGIRALVRAMKKFGEITVVAESITIAPADDIGRDNRPADEAGEEDGYWDGYYDGIAGQENKPHDVTPAYSSRSQRETYRASYATGYARGYEEGQQAS